MYSIGKLARMFNLSRSTLLYYDRLRLLSPTSRAPNGYREYSERDAERLRLICTFRRAGIPLKEIRQLLSGSSEGHTEALQRHLLELADQMQRIRRQQLLIVELLRKQVSLEDSEELTKDRWISILEKAGFSPEDMQRWHREFEATAPGRHERFLQLLGIPAVEIRQIRAASRTT